MFLHRIQWALGGILAASSISIVCVAAPSPENELKYPWDKRPDVCFLPNAASRKDCAIDHWADWEESISKIIMLYETEQFSLLDRALGEIAMPGRLNLHGTRMSGIIIPVFSRLTPSDSSMFRAEEASRIGRWRKARPQSQYAPILEARHHVSKAWSIRGGGYADTVSAKSWELFYKSNRDAEHLMLAVPADLRNTESWYEEMIEISQNLDEPTQQPIEIFNSAVSKWPDYYAFYRRIVSRMTPKWGGSWREIEQFSSYWTGRHFETDGGALYARIYVRLLNEASFREMSPDWQKLKRGFTSLLARYPQPDYRNNFASFACAAGDKETYVSILRELPAEKVIAKEWLQGHSYQACGEWAYAKS